MEAYVRYTTNFVCISEKLVDGIFGSVQLHLVIVVCVALKLVVSAVAPACPTASVFPPKPCLITRDEY